MNGTKKILISLFCILILVTVSELVYYLSVIRFQPTAVNNPAKIETTANPLSKPTPFKPALDPATLKNLTNYKTSIVESSVVNIKLSGTISELPTAYKGDYVMEILLVGNDGQTDLLAFTSDRLAKTKTYLLSNDKESLFDINQLKVDDKISVWLNFDLLKPNIDNLLEAKIVRYEKKS